MACVEAKKGAVAGDPSDGENLKTSKTALEGLVRELGEIWHFESWRERYLIIARRIRCPVHAGVLFGFYPILLQ
jgi:hypothetical protein